MTNTLRWLTGLALMALVATAGVWAQAPSKATAMLEAAIQKEVADGDVTGAIAQYQEILRLFPAERTVAASALWHLGQCYERKRDARARQMYERLLQGYSDSAFADRARTRLAALVDAPMDVETSAVVDRASLSSRDRDALVAGGDGNNNNGNSRFVIFADLAYHNPETGEVRRLIDGARSAAYPVVSPNNQQVAYLSWSGDLQENLRQVRLGHASSRATAELRVVNVTGQNDRLILKDVGVPWLRPFAWSPDGQEIVTLVERANGTRQIALVNTSNSSMRVLKTLQGLSPVSMGFSPDGQYISYEVPTPRDSGELEFFYLPIDPSLRNPLAERRYAVSLGGQRVGNATAEQSIIHVLNRVSFGPRLGDIENVKKIGIDKYIEQQLHPESIPDPVVDAKLKNFPSLKMTLPQLLETGGPPVLEGLRRRATLFESREMADRAAQAKPGSSPLPPVASEPPGKAYAGRPGDLEVQAARIIRAVYSERQLQEVMIDFWMNHFNVVLKDDQVAPDFEENTIRRHAFGKFEDLLMSVAKNPKMLYYLDNWKSSAPADVMQARFAAIKATGDAAQYLPVVERMPFLEKNKGLNENYARELMELHTLGVDGGYAQADVVEVAKILTGWTISGKGVLNGHEEDGLFFFDPLMHVEGDKVVLGQTIKSGGVDEGEQLLKILAHHPSTARFISTKLARRFIADDPPAAVVTAASRTFMQTGGDIREVLRTILTSPQFRSPEVYRAKIKKPLELVVSALRAVDADFGDGPAVEKADSIDGLFMNRQRGLISRMGELLYNYQAPDGNPDVGAAWINSNALLVRLEFANNLATGKVQGVKVNVASAQLLLGQLGLPKPTPAQIEQTRAMMDKTPAPAAGPTSSNPQQMMMGSGSGTGSGKAPVDPAAVVVASMLGSPQFQKR